MKSCKECGYEEENGHSQKCPHYKNLTLEEYMKNKGWKEELKTLMCNLPVNDYRVYHKNLITGKKNLTFRGKTIESFIEKTLTQRNNEVVEMIEGMKFDRCSLAKYKKAFSCEPPQKSMCVRNGLYVGDIAGINHNQALEEVIKTLKLTK